MIVVIILFFWLENKLLKLNSENRLFEIIILHHLKRINTRIKSIKVEITGNIKLCSRFM